MLRFSLPRLPSSPPASRRLAWRRCVALAALLLLLAIGLGTAAAQEGRIIDREPFDRITLNEVNESKVLLVKPVNLPNRRVPAEPKGNDKIRVHVLEDPQEYELAWQHIDKFELYEQMVLVETNRLAAEGKLDEAFEYFTFLFERYPQTEGLAEAQQTYLYLSAGAAFKQQKYDEALAIAEELLAQNATYTAGESGPPLLTVLGNIADKLIAAYVEKEDYRAARILLARLSADYKAQGEPFAVRWRTELARRAAVFRDRAQAHMEAGRFVEAYDAGAAMRTIWPEVEGGAELTAEVARRHPLVVVGVEHPALQFDARSLQNPAARRAGRLVERGLLEFTGAGPEGGEYVCPLGSVEQSVDGLELTFNLRGGAGLTGYDLSQLLLGWARPGDPDFQPAWARTLASVQVTNVNRVTANLKAPHVLPPALLQGSYAANPEIGNPGMRGNGPFYVLSRTPELTRYNANESVQPRRAGQLAEVSERLYTDPQRALIGLQRGEINVLERVFPGDVATVRADPDLAAQPLAMPTTHLLIVRDRHPYLTNRTFRRALVYGSNRDQILHQALLRGRTLPGYQLISAPFPAPTGSGSSQGYAYDQQIAPRPYEPRLALTLRMVAQNEVKSAFEKLEQKPPALEPIVLGHPADEVSRIACRALAKQWGLIGVKCKLVEFPLGQFDDPKNECDLIYVQAAMLEPVVDAGRLLGPEGIAPAGNAFIQLTLRQIERATNWQQARERFRQLHRLLHEDVTVIPLWQTFDYYAYRKSLGGLSAARVTLYDNVEAWQVSPQLAQLPAVRQTGARP
ncbi:MAG: ABC transporter substrate-binding protein [Pirellulaceae bacterium]